MPPEKRTPTPSYCRYRHKYMGCTGIAVDTTAVLLLCEAHTELAREYVAELDQSRSKR
ncbi:hypothetical protein FHR83_007035 [Actinoplanes campanulatus]|uniref:Uncharacterized protein n=1 Tax=Actinoplanes campanulatus TaxID=113559 RepID=A0A7W5AP23_9ACTN|nr:hypothetical protein [Actinoplanes campanulatus]MBB3099329.1 hypothetical protein [Actinoplanes campanulatus]GGN40451.1 hypothetical protein GCM10010109_69560 [Actinoplanes campanulatus]